MDLNDKEKIPSLFLCPLAEMVLNTFRTKIRKREIRKSSLDPLQRGVSCSSKIERFWKQRDKNFRLSSKMQFQQALQGGAEESICKCTFGWYQREEEF